MDGKTVRGSRPAEKSVVVLLAAMDHTGTALAQRQIADKSNEIPLRTLAGDSRTWTASWSPLTRCTPSMPTAPAPAGPTTWQS
ncbi:hypothetical protein [Streptomyces sp. SM1]